MNIAVYRIIGIILLLGAPITGWIQQGITLNVFIFFVSGAILLFSKEKLGLAEWRKFKRSFSDAKTYGWVFIYDIVFWLIFAIVSFVYSSYMDSLVEGMGSLGLQSAGMLDPEFVSNNVTLIQSFIAQVVVGFLITMFIIWIAYSYFSGAVWSRIMHKKYGKKLIRSYFFSGAVISLFSATLLTIAVAATKPEVLIYALPIAILIVVHFTFFINAHVAKLSSGRKGIREGIKEALQLKRLVHPFAYVGLTYLVLMIIVTLTTPYETVLLIASGASIVLIMAWLKMYLREILR